MAGEAVEEGPVISHSIEIRHKTHNNGPFYVDFPQTLTMDTWEWGDLQLWPLFQQLFHRVKRRSRKKNGLRRRGRGLARRLV
jgi:hypothetical protein